MGIEPEEGFVAPDLIIGLLIRSNYSVVASVIEVDRHSIRLLQFQDSKFLVVIESLLLQVVPEPDQTSMKPGSQSQTNSLSKVVVEVFLGPGCEEIERKLTILLQMIEVRFCFRQSQNHKVALEEVSLLEYLLKEPITHYVKKIQGFEDCLGLASSVCQRYRLIEDQTNHKTFAVKPIDLSEYMRIDNNVVQSLNIMPKRESLSLTEKERDLSLFGILDTCKTQMGPRTLKRWLLQPMVDPLKIEERLDLVEYLVLNESILNFLSNSFLARVTDLEKIGVRLYKTNQGKRSKSSILDVVKVYQAVMLANTAYFHLRDQVVSDQQGGLPGSSSSSRKPKLHQTASQRAGYPSSSTQLSLEDEALQSLYEAPDEQERTTSLMHLPSRKLETETERTHRLSRVVSAFERCLKFFGNFVECVEKYVDLDKAQQGEYSLKEAASKELAGLLAKRKVVQNKVKAFVREFEEELQIDIGVEQDGQGAFIMKIPKKVEKKIGLGGYGCKFKMVSARANHIMLTCSELKTLSSEFAEVEAAVFEEQQNASQAILLNLASFYPAVEELGEFLGELDAVSSMARFSRSSLSRTMVRPIFNEGDRIVMRKSRHPLLDKTLGSGAVSNDCEMIRGKSSFHIITGPNMGGKSTFIRQVAVNIILAQIGSYCCAEYAEVPIFDSLVTRVGAGDAQSKGLSTWMSELLEVSCMLESASSRTFLVIDELGRGTSTSEGVGMTYAIAEHIIDKMDSYCLFATHYFELTSLEQARPCAKNYHVQAEMRHNNLEMSYQVRPGHTNKSFGVQVLSMLKFPKPVIEFAHQLSGVLDRASFLVGSTDPEKIRRSRQAKGNLDEELQPSHMNLDSKVQFIKFSKQCARSEVSSKHEEDERQPHIHPQADQVALVDKLRLRLAKLQREESYS